MVFESSDMVARKAGFTDISALPGLASLWAESQGDPSICVAVLDGPVDQSHPCFDGANLTRLTTLVSDIAGSGLMSGHGTHITSTIFGQRRSPVIGIAPSCRGLIIPVFSDNQRGKLSQMDLARAINQAVEAGAHVINISGGQLSQSGKADPMLVNAVRFCNDEGVLIVAAAGNDACECLHVPAALPSVLAVGAMNAQGLPFDFSNWGETYQHQGILAPGENILGAEPGGGTAINSGTSFATPIVSGIVALLLSLQLKRGNKPDPHAIRDAILKSALPCNLEFAADCRRFLAGSLNIPGAYALITEGGREKVSENSDNKELIIQPSEFINIDIDKEGNNQINNIENTQSPEESVNQSSNVSVQAASAATSGSIPTTIHNSENIMNVTPSQVTTSSVTSSNLVASGNCNCEGGTVASSIMPSNMPISLVYALGVVGYDFGTEARRDSFKQLMPLVWSDNGEEVPFPVPDPPPRPNIFPVPANPYDARQMARYLENNISEAASLIWTLNLELTPIYAIEPQAPFALTVYETLRDFLAGQVLDENAEDYIERVAIPAVLTGRNVTLYSGQVVPVIEPLNTRGMYGWQVNALIHAVMNAIRNQDPPPNLTPQQEAEIEYSLRNFLMRIYYDLRNLGQTSAERAQNFASVNTFQNADALIQVLSNQSRSWGNVGDPQAVTMQLDSFEIERSPFCRKDSDCWDVKIKFFDPENDRRAKRVLRYTIDVSDIMPVTLGQVRIWDVAN